MNDETPEDLGPEIPVAPAAWASWLNVLLGIWEAASPWVLGYAAFSGVAAENALSVGVITIVAGLYAALTWYTWPHWVNALAGTWLILSPYILGFSHVSGFASVNDVVVGVLMIVFALIAGLSKPQVLIPE